MLLYSLILMFIYYVASFFGSWILITLSLKGVKIIHWITRFGKVKRACCYWLKSASKFLEGEMNEHISEPATINWTENKRFTWDQFTWGRETTLRLQANPEILISWFLMFFGRPSEQKKGSCLVYGGARGELLVRLPSCYTSKAQIFCVSWKICTATEENSH